MPGRPPSEGEGKQLWRRSRNSSTGTSKGHAAPVPLRKAGSLAAHAVANEPTEAHDAAA